MRQLMLILLLGLCLVKVQSQQSVIDIDCNILRLFPARDFHGVREDMLIKWRKLSYQYDGIHLYHGRSRDVRCNHD